MKVTLSGNPFVGLRPFDSQESLLFFGRQEQTIELLQRLHDHHFVAVIGSSGSGKSSLVKAGLIPRLKAGYLVNDRSRWVVAAMKPGLNPLYNLAGALLGQMSQPVLTATAFAEAIKAEGVDAILHVVQPAWQQNTNLFILVDQFEELFRFILDLKEGERKDEAIDFVNILLALTRETGFPVYVVITMRSDFIGDCARFFGLPEAMNESQYLVPRLNRIQLKSSIEGPVKLYNGRISPALTAQLLNDVQVVKDELPLLQHALMRIWDLETNTGKNGELDLQDYLKIGGIEKALSNHADEAMEGMPEGELQLTKKIFQVLTTIDDNGRKIRRPAHLQELQAITGAGRDAIMAVVNRFIEGNRSFLIVTEMDNKDDLLIDISHESLIRQWGRLNEWVNEEAESAMIFQRLTESAKLYKEGFKDLLTGNELQRLLEWRRAFQPGAVWAFRYSADYKESLAYLQQSEQTWIAEKMDKEKQRRRNLLKLRLLFAAALLVSMVIGILAYIYFKANIKTQNQLAMNYWNNSQQVSAENNVLSALHFTAEGLMTSKDDALTRKLYTDIEGFLPLNNLRQIIIQQGEVTSAVFSPDGKQVLTACQDSTVRLWNTFTGDPSGVIIHPGSVKTALFSHDGSLVVTAGFDGKICLWQTHTGKQVGQPMRHANNVNSIVFSPDGKKLLTAGSDSIARIWDVATGVPTGVYLKQKYSIHKAVFSADGKKIATAGFDSTARIWDAATGKQLGIPLKHNELIVTDASFSADGKKILTSGEDNTARVWDVATGKQLGPSMKQEGQITSAVYSPDGRAMLTAGRDHNACLWDAETGLQRFPALRLDGEVRTAVFSPDGKQLLTATDFTAYLWDAETGKQIGISMKHDGLITSAAFSADGRYLVTTGRDSTARLWNAAPPASTASSDIPAFRVNGAAFSPDGKQLLTAGADSTARLFSLVTGMQTGPALQHSGAVNSAAFSNDGRWMVTAADDSMARIWKVSGGGRVITALKHKGEVRMGVFSPDAKKVLTASSELNVYLWDAATGKQTGNLVHDGAVNSAVFSPDGRKVLTASWDSKVRVWEVATGKLSGAAIVHEAEVSDAVFSPDGKKILTICAANVSQWDALTHDRRDAQINYRYVINSAVYSPDGKLIVTTGRDNMARLWDAATGKQTGPSLKHATEVYSGVFSPDGKEVVTLSSDSVVCRWDVTTGKKIGPAVKPARSAVYSPDGKKMAIIHYDNTVHLSDLEADLDLGPSLFRQQAIVITGCALNTGTGELQPVPAVAWRAIKREYGEKASSHYKTCHYPQRNFWRQMYPEEAKKIRL